jgi:flagellar hook protein FlgE
MSFNTALSGLNAAQTDLDVTAHNIANASTVGFKESRAEFADIYANSLYDVSTTAPGRGVRVSRVAQQFSQGTIDFTGNNMDLAINGNGFFIMQDSAGADVYTRAGQFGLDREGYIVSATGDYLQAFQPLGDSANASNVVFNTGETDRVQIPLTSGAPQSTGDEFGIRVDVNLNAEDTALTVANFDRNNPDTYNNVTSTTMYDSMGVAYPVTFYFIKDDTAAPQLEWNVRAYLQDPADATNDAEVDLGNLVFDSTGTLDPAATTLTNLDLGGAGWAPSNGGEFALDDATGAYTNIIPLDFASSTQYGQPFAVNEITQDGFTAGQLAGVDIDQTGIVFARFTNGDAKTLGQIALADFRNPQGLRQLGDTQWAETYSAGDVRKVQAGTSGLGLVQAGAVENANVDLAKQLVNLIISQRNYQANAKTIETANAITQTMINMR